MRALAIALEAYPERIRLNQARGAFQVTASCSPDLIVAHVVLGAAELSRLASGAD